MLQETNTCLVKLLMKNICLFCSNAINALILKGRVPFLDFSEDITQSRSTRKLRLGKQFSRGPSMDLGTCHGASSSWLSSLGCCLLELRGESAPCKVTGRPRQGCVLKHKDRCSSESDIVGDKTMWYGCKFRFLFHDFHFYGLRFTSSLMQ